MSQNTKIIIGLAVIMAAALGVGLLMQSDFSFRGEAAVSTYTTSRLETDEQRFDFGTISMEAGDVSHIFRVENVGTESVVIQKIYTSCMCTTASITDASGRKRGTFGMPGHGMPSRTNIQVGPGESITAEATFDPAAHGPSGVGFARRSIYLETNSQKSPKLELSFQAMVTR